MNGNVNGTRESTPRPRRMSAGDGNNRTRRSVVKLTGASLAVGSLAGCTGLLSEDTFDASPIAFAGGWDGSGWQTVELPRLADQEIIVLPTAVAEVGVSADLDPIGEITATSYGTTHPILGVTDDGRQFVDGELITLTTPKIEPPGRDDQNPVTDLAVEDLVGDFGSVATHAADFGNPHDAVVSRDFDSGMPSRRKLVGSAYRGIAREVTLTSPVETSTGWFDPNSPPCGTAEGEILGVAPDPDGEPVSFFGMKQERDDDHVILLGWVRQFQTPADPPPPTPAAVDQFGSLFQQAVEAGCVTLSAATDTEWNPGDGDCPGTGGGAVAIGRKRLLPQLVAILHEVSTEISSGVARARDLLEKASDDGRDEEQEAAISDAREAVNRIERLNDDIDDRLRGMPDFDSDRDITELRETFKKRGVPSIKAIGENAGRIQENAGGAREAVMNTIGAGADDVIVELAVQLGTLDDMGQMTREAGCTVETGQDSVYVR